jgi:hypothetical protein
MTDKDDAPPPEPQKDSEEKAEVAVRSILRRAQIRRHPEVDLLNGVQRRIRERSRGRFYADGWSRRTSPTSTYIVTSILMLVILSLVYFVILPGMRFQ